MKRLGVVAVLVAAGIALIAPPPLMAGVVDDLLAYASQTNYGAVNARYVSAGTTAAGYPGQTHSLPGRWHGNAGTPGSAGGYTIRYVPPKRETASAPTRVAGNYGYYTPSPRQYPRNNSGYTYRSYRGTGAGRGYGNAWSSPYYQGGYGYYRGGGYYGGYGSGYCAGST